MTPSERKTRHMSIFDTLVSEAQEEAPDKPGDESSFQALVAEQFGEDVAQEAIYQPRERAHLETQAIISAQEQSLPLWIHREVTGQRYWHLDKTRIMRG